MEVLNYNIIAHEILPRLPFKSVVRWMCTSNFWYHAIRSHEFSKMYLKKSMNSDTNRCLLLSTTDSPAPTEFFCLAFDDNDNMLGRQRRVDHPLPDPEKQTKVVGHSNGLVCVCNHNREMINDLNDEYALAIWNPSIHTFKKVPMLPQFASGRDILRYPPSYGFGYNPKVDDYEIVQISQRVDLRTITLVSEVRIYTLGTNDWKRILDLDVKYKKLEIVRGFLGIRSFSCPFVNGHIHWLLRTFSRVSFKILAFDVANEEFFDYRVPDAVNGIRDEVHLHGVGDHLYLLDRRDSIWVDVWRMNEYKNELSWDKLYSIRPGNWRPISLFPLLSSKTGRGILNLVDVGMTLLLWIDLNGFRVGNVRYLEHWMRFRAVSFVQSFLLGEGQ